MNILLVDDNRDVVNWGCRATSTALSQLIGTEHTVSAAIDKQTVDSRSPVYPSLFDSSFMRSIRRGVYGRNVRWIKKLFSMQNDFLADDPRRSVANMVELVQLKGRYEDVRRVYQSVEQCDAVVINGEGSMIFTAEPRRDLQFQMMMISLAKEHFKKPVFYVNAMVSDCPSSGRNQQSAAMSGEMLQLCDSVTLRDPVSAQIAKEISPGANSVYIPDALFSWYDRIADARKMLPANGDMILPFREADDRFFGSLDFSAPYICVSGSSSAAWNQSDAVVAYTNLVNELKRLGLPIYLVPTCVGDRFLFEVAKRSSTPIVPTSVPIVAGGAILANAALMVSGRYHPSILASLGGTPSVYMGSNSHKTISLQNVLQYPEPIEFEHTPSESECIRIAEKAENYLGQGDKLREHVRSAASRCRDETLQLLEILRETGSDRSANASVESAVVS